MTGPKKLNLKSLADALGEKPWIEAVLSAVLQKLSVADSMDQVCRAFVSTHGVDTIASAAIFCRISESGDLSLEGSFGKEVNKLKNFAFKLNDESSLYSLSAPTVFGVHPEGSSFVFIPAMEQNVCIGVLLLAISSSGDSTFELNGNFIDDLLPSYLGTLVNKIRSQNELQLHNRKTGQRTPSLSPRQLEILGLISDGLTNAEISQTLNVSLSTVRHETIKIYSFLEVPSRKLAVEAGKSLGLI